MASTTADLWFRFFADTKGLSRGTSDASRDLSKTEKAAAGASRGFSNMGRALAAAGLAIGAKEVLDFAIASGKMAEQAQIAADAAETALGPAADTLRTRFEDLRGVMGFNSGEFDTLIAKQGLLVTSLGASQEAAGDLIGDLVEIGGDLAAFTGEVGETEAAIDAVGAAIRGEFDPLEQWGVKLNEAQIKAEIARREGVDPLFAALEDGEQRLIVIRDLITEGAAPAIGSLGDAADTAAGKANDLNSSLEDLQIELGEALRPAIEEGLDLLLDTVNLLNDAADGTRTWTDRLISLGDALAGLVGDTNAISEEWALWTGRIDAARRNVDNFVRSIGNIPNLIANPFREIRAPSLPSWVPRFQKGGTVPGPRGAPTPAIVHGGEEILRPDQQHSMSSGAGVVINVTAGLSDPQTIAREIVNLLQIYNRTNGPLDVAVRGAS